MVVMLININRFRSSPVAPQRDSRAREGDRIPIRLSCRGATGRQGPLKSTHIKNGRARKFESLKLEISMTNTNWEALRADVTRRFFGATAACLVLGFLLAGGAPVLVQ